MPDMAELMNDPDIREAMADPSVVAILQKCMSDPAQIMEYRQARLRRDSSATPLRRDYQRLGGKIGCNTRIASLLVQHSFRLARRAAGGVPDAAC